jgi:UDP-2,3-diacylglucosamine hydrolase
VVGLPTIEQMKSSRATALAVDAGRTLLFDRQKLIELADAADIAIQAFAPPMDAEPKSPSGGINKE